MPANQKPIHLRPKYAKIKKLKENYMKYKSFSLYRAKEGKKQQKRKNKIYNNKIHMLPNKKPLKLSHKMSNKQTREASVKEKKTVRDKRNKNKQGNYTKWQKNLEFKERSFKIYIFQYSNKIFSYYRFLIKDLGNL